MLYLLLLKQIDPKLNLDLKYRMFLAALLSAAWLTAFPQEQGSAKRAHYSYFQMMLHSGTTWSRSEYLSEQFESGFMVYELRFGYQSTGEKPWQQYHHYPRYGVGVCYADLVLDRQDTTLGNPFSAFFFFSAPWLRLGRITLNSDISVGLSYTSLIHDPVSNPYNDVIASRVNLYFNYNLNIYYILNNRIDLFAGYGLTHYSNGAIQSPQKGINNWGASLGLSYHFKYPPTPADLARNYDSRDVRPDLVRVELPDSLPGNEIQLMAAVGVVDRQAIGQPEGPRYITSSFTIDYAIPITIKNRLTFGLDILYDSSLEIGIKGIPPEEVTTFQKTYLGSHMGYRILIGRLTLMYNFGTYFMQHSYDRGFWFMRAGGRIRLADPLHIHIAIKTKAGIRSDWIEWGLAWYLPAG